ncbi:hypothetical protein M5J20_06235 [Corynebacterium sp. TA-R-1]|uniref:AMIN-like domain-containing protein n=1 Tax=Corynebacterium stercoris TaxID=2943490 RepID=A0ABT1G184_9CORY|nr:hypothetical protein [Corynebacterium stercoris]MCP1387788.1 hypothetical protein [Corynebacterium stercoris]
MNFDSFPQRRRLLAGMVAAALSASLAGCAGISPGTSANGTAPAPLLAGVSMPSTSALQPLGTADPSPKTQRPSEPALLAVAGVRIGNHQGFDRVVVDLEGDGDPGWYVDYTSTPMHGTVGRPLTVSGNAFLNINIDGTVPPSQLGIDTSMPVERYSATGNIVDVVNGGTYEGRSQVVVGLRSEAPYSVQVLEDPKRLVIDIVQN